MFNKKLKEEIKHLKEEVQELKKRVILYEKEDFTRVGTPVRVMTKTKEGWRFSAGQISRVQGSEVDIWVFPCTEEAPFLLKSPRHQDFMKKGFPWWSYVVKNYCTSE